LFFKTQKFFFKESTSRYFVFALLVLTNFTPDWDIWIAGLRPFL